MEKHETRTSTLFASCAYKFYTLKSSTGYYHASPYDERLLPELDNLLQQKKEKLAVFIHLMGSHSNYARRFPEQFNIIKNDSPYCTQFSDVINDYDNSILYTDFILDSIINRIKSENRPSAMLYFADHSDAVYEDCKTAGHSESAKSRFMFEIPFILYLSPQYKVIHKNFSDSLHDYTNRSYQTDDLIYSILSLSDVTFNGFKSQKDIFSQNFKPEKRLLSGDDYDDLYRRVPSIYEE